MKNAHIISIGNELLIGDTVNTNASWLGGTLTESGITVNRIFVIPDDFETIKNQVQTSLKECDLTVVTGGLGPTHDDVTKKAVAALFNSPLIRNEQVYRHIERIFEKRNFALSDENKDQASVPENCDVLFNKQGTAPGMWFNANDHYLAVLPGVPYEMQHIMKEEVIPRLQTIFSGREKWVTDYFHTAGIPESTLSENIGALAEFVDNGVGVAFLPSFSGVKIRISASGADKNQAEKKLGKLRKIIRRRAGDHLFGEGKNCTLAGITGELLAEKELTLAVAESCTGGLLANSITDIPGSSRYMKGGLITYSNDMKIRYLKVSKEDLSSAGAVSKQVALQMAKGVAESCGADIGVSATGIAGPGGGTAQKPVGTVWMGFYIQGKHFALKAVFTNDRLINKERTVTVILDTLRRQLLGMESYPYHLKPQFP